MSTNKENSAQANFDNDEISLKELILKMKKWLEFLKSKYKTIIIASLIFALSGLTIAYFVKPNYIATLTFTLEEEKGGAGGLSGAMGLASSLGFDLGGSAGGAFTSTNIIELMKSRLIIEKTLLSSVQNTRKPQITFAEYYIQINNLRKDWKNKPKIKDIQFPVNADRKEFSLQQDSILQVIYKLVTDKKNFSIAQKDKKVTIITMEISSKSEIFSKLFCERLAEEISKFYVETKSKKARINVDALQKQVDSVRISLNSAINGVAAESDNVYNLNPSLNTKTTPSKKRQIDVQANTAILTQLVTQLEIAKVGLRKETPLIQTIDKPILPLEKDEFGIIKSFLICGFLGAFISSLYLVFNQLYQNMMK
jgi:uncharacterized protein involved in exopolysaccharide biosynthesis